MAIQEDFINSIYPIVQKFCKEYGYNYPSAIIAQACCESNYGRSKLSANYHNYFGLKCGSSWNGASVNMKTNEEYTAGTITSIRDNFRAYPNLEEGIKGYFDFISGFKRYDNLHDAISTYDYIDKIKSDGYATSSTYVSALTKLIQIYNLEKYDTFAPIEQKIEYYPIPTFTLVECLERINVNSSYSNRKLIAEKNNIENYKGTAEQNLYMLDMLLNGKLIK